MKSKLRPRAKMWLSTSKAEGVFGDGKWRLLKAIDKKRSLSAAAEWLGIGYRKAWGDLQKAERELGVVLIERRRGGKDHGSASLTESGREWMKAYTEFRSSVEASIDRAFARHIQPLSGHQRRRRR